MRGLPRLVGGQREQVTPKLPRAKRWAKFHYQAALGLGPPRVRNPCRDANVLAGPHARSLMAAPDNQNTSLNDEPLLLQSVCMHRPAVGARGGIDVHSSHLVSGIVITPDPHPESLDPYAGRHGENLTNPRSNCEAHIIRTAHLYCDGSGSTPRVRISRPFARATWARAGPSSSVGATHGQRSRGRP